MSSREGGRIVLLAATRRGVRVAERLMELVPPARVTLVTFKEEPGEPLFFDDMQALADRRGAAFVEARQVGSPRLAALWEDEVELLLAVSWRYMVPQRVFTSARRGAFVFHDSILPRYRGFAPTVWAIVNGEDHTGATLFEMVDAVDAGAIIAQRRVPIHTDDTVATVIEAVTDAYVAILEGHLGALLDGSARREAQDEAVATYTCKRVAADGRIDWGRSTREIHNLVRAHTRPYWGAFTTLDGRPLRIWAAQPLADYPPYVGRVPGRVVEIRPDRGTVVLTGDGAILLTEVQLESEPATTASSVLRSPATTLGR